MAARIATATEFFEVGREVPEWIGATPDTPIPQRVKDRVFLRHGGKCHWTKRSIRPGEPWDVDHVLALKNGGENRETNLAPILRGKPHKEKTALDVAVKKKTYRTRSKHLGLKSPSKSWNTKVRRKMNGEVVPR
jgi:5-methylcytosine-specific restriction protein A